MMKSKLVKLALVNTLVFSVMAGSTLALACPNGWSGNPCSPTGGVKKGSVKAIKEGATERQKKDEYLKDTLEPSPYKDVPNAPSGGIKCAVDKNGKKDCMGRPTTE